MLMEYYLEKYRTAFAHTDRDLWNYEDGCVLIGLSALYEATGNEAYLDAVRMFIDRYIDDDGNIRLYKREDYNIDFIPSGRVLFTLYRKTGREAYRHAVEELMEQIRHQPRTQSGSFWHKKIYPNQVWLDGLYMGLPFYGMYQKAFGNGDMSDILNQFDNCRRHLFDEKEQMYYHAWDESRAIYWCDKQTGLSPNYWLRSIGWLLMAYADIYEMLEAPEEKARIARLWREAVDGLLPHQDPKSGMFLQLPTLHSQKGNYPETSGTLMVAYSLMKGVRLGMWSAETYGAKGVELMFAVEASQFRLAPDGLHLGGMCKGAGLGPDGNYRRNGTAAYYLSEDVVEDEQKGVGVAMMAMAEFINLRNTGCQVGPRVAVFTKPYDPIMPNEIKDLEKRKLAEQENRG